MNVVIGQYYNTNSCIHRLDARVKIIATACYIFAVLLSNNFKGYFWMAVFMLSVIYAAKLPLRLLLKSLRGILFIILFTILMNLLFYNNGTTVFSLGIVNISTGGIYRAVFIAARLVLLVVGSSVLTLATTPLQLTEGIEYILKPFKRFGLPAHDIAMMMSIALRFIPTLIEELDKIKKAQMSRGADFESGGIIKRANALIPLLVPLFVSSFRRADDLATAMDARCYRGDVNRTKLHPLMLKRTDCIAMLCVAVFLIITVFLRVYF